MQSPSQLLASRTAPSLLDRVAGTGLLLFGVLPLIAERSSAIILPMFALTVFMLSRIEAQRIVLLASGGLAVIWLALGYSALSAAWATDPGDALAHVGVAMVMTASAQAIASWIGAQDAARLRFMGFWLVVGCSIGLAYLVIEVVSEQGIKRFLLNTFMKPHSPDKILTFDAKGQAWIKAFELNRNVAAANFLLWPALLSAWCLFKPPLRTVACALLFVTVLVVTAMSRHESSKAAFILSAAIFLLAYFWPRLAVRSVGAGFVAMVVAVIPLSIYAHQSLHLDKADWLQNSAQERIEIWGTLASRVFDAPALGVGVRSTHAMNLERQAEIRKGKTDSKHVIPPHAHNVYLQAWFELGAVGAVLLLLSGLALLQLVSRVPAEALPFTLAAFVTGIVEVASSWDVWQRWFFALLAISAVTVVLAARLAPIRDGSRDASR